MSMSTLPIEFLVSAPLTSIIKVNKKLALTTAQFLYEFGLEYDSNKDEYKGIEISFEYTIVKDGINIIRKITVPLITLIQIPNLLINNFNINFKTHIGENLSTRSMNTQSSSMTEAELRSSLWDADVSAINKSVSSKLGSNKKRKSDTSATYSFNIQGEDRGQSEGLLKIIDMLTSPSAIKAVDEKEYKKK